MSPERKSSLMPLENLPADRKPLIGVDSLFKYWRESFYSCRFKKAISSFCLLIRSSLLRHILIISSFPSSLSCSNNIELEFCYAPKLFSLSFSSDKILIWPEKDSGPYILDLYFIGVNLTAIGMFFMLLFL